MVSAPELPVAYYPRMKIFSFIEKDKVKMNCDSGFIPFLGLGY